MRTTSRGEVIGLLGVQHPFSGFYDDDSNVFERHAVNDIDGSAFSRVMAGRNEDFTIALETISQGVFHEIVT